MSDNRVNCNININVDDQIHDTNTGWIIKDIPNKFTYLDIIKPPQRNINEYTKLQRTNYDHNKFKHLDKLLSDHDEAMIYFQKKWKESSNKSCFNNIGRIKLTPYIPIDKLYTTSGSCIIIYSNSEYIIGLSAAHNFINTIVPPVKAAFLELVDITTKQIKTRYFITHYTLFPEYKLHQNNSGKDLMLIIAENGKGSDKYILKPYDINLVINKKLNDNNIENIDYTLAGFPGHQQNKLMEQSGRDIEFIDDPPIIKYKDINTYKGQSGGPLFGDMDGKLLVYGIHKRGPDQSPERYNQATRITAKHMNWITSKIGCDYIVKCQTNDKLRLMYTFI